LDLLTELLGVIDVLESAGIDYAVCGGLAMAIYGFPRATQDIDLLIQESQLDAAIECLEPTGFMIPGGVIKFQGGTPDEQRVFRVSKAIGCYLLTLDLLLVTSVLEDVWGGRIQVDIGPREISVVSRDGFTKMKRLAGRSQDLVDLETLGIRTDDNQKP